jgi:hypothetical protein
MLADRRSELERRHGHTINPGLPADLGLTSWERHTEVLRQAYRGTAMWIEAQVAQRDPHLLAVIGSAR